MIVTAGFSLQQFKKSPGIVRGKNQEVHREKAADRVKICSSGISPSFHGFVKKTNKIPKRDLDLAQN